MDGGMAGGLGRLRKRLDQSLFPAPRRVRSGLATWEGALLVTGFLVLACVLQLFRIGPSSGVGSLWAEDAPVFLHGGLNEGLLSSVTTPYAGILVDLAEPEVRGEPSWSTSLKAASAECKTKPISEATVYTSPPGWGLPISCDRLESDTG